jgi:hypothetical protein
MVGNNHTNKYYTMRITDIIRGILDQVDAEVAQSAQQPEVVVAVPTEQSCAACGSTPCACEQEQPDLLAVIQQLAGVEVSEPTLGYANQPEEHVAPIGASFPGGDDVHQRKNPADIRTNAPSMYPNYQAK